MAGLRGLESGNSACREEEIQEAEKHATAPRFLSTGSPCSASPADKEIPSVISNPQKTGQSANNSVEDSGWISCESKAMHNVSPSSIPNCGFIESLPIYYQVKESTISAEDNIHSLEGIDTYRSKGFQYMSDEESSLEMIDIEQADLHKKSVREVLPDEQHLDHLENKKYSIQPHICRQIKECSSMGNREIGVSKYVTGIIDCTNSSTQCTVSHTGRTSHRKRSPLNWFPRRRTQSYLEKKIRMFQEAEGMNATLDETLGDSNPHMSRIEREKLAAQAAAEVAMRARKAALVEASWCRILKAASIPCELAEVQWQKAEKNAAEALNAATAVGVVMHNKAGGPKQSFEVETSTTDGNSTHTVSASFETAFEVDREVAGALKMAFFRLAHLPHSAIKDVFGANGDVCIRMILNADGKDIPSDNNSACLDHTCSKPFSSEVSSESDAQTEGEFHTDSELERDLEPAALDAHAIRTRKHAVRLPFQKHRSHLKRSRSKQVLAKEATISEELIEVMVERVKLLKEDELISLAMIVATRGLSAMLKDQSKEQEVLDKCTSGGLGDVLVKHVSRLEAEKAAAAAASARAGTIAEDTKSRSSSEILPDLGSILVKHVSKFEREVQEAKKLANAKQTEDHIGEMKKHYAESLSGNPRDKDSFETVPDLGSILVKHVSKFEREVQEAKKLANAKQTEDHIGEMKEHYAESLSGNSRNKDSFETVPDLGSILTKQLSKLERDVQVAKELMKTSQTEHRRAESKQQNVETLDKLLAQNAVTMERENLIAGEKFAKASGQQMDSSMEQTNRNIIDNKDHNKENKENIEVIKEINLDTLETGNGRNAERLQEFKQQHSNMNSNEDLDKILVKHMSRLEKEKLAALSLAKEASQDMQRKKQQHEEDIEENLNEIIVERMPKLEAEKSASANEAPQRLQKMQQQYNGESLDKVLIKHVSKLEKEKLKASAQEKELIQNIQIKQHQHDGGGESLDKVLVKHISKLEKEKLMAKDSFQTVQRKQDQPPMGEGSLDQILVKHMSRLEKEKLVALASVSETVASQRVQRQQYQCDKKSEDSLDKVLVKKMSRLEIENQQAAMVTAAAAGCNPLQNRRNVRAQEIQAAWGGLSLGNSLKRHVSRLELDKAAWCQAEEEERRRASLALKEAGF